MLLENRVILVRKLICSRCETFENQDFTVLGYIRRVMSHQKTIEIVKQNEQIVYREFFTEYFVLNPLFKSNKKVFSRCPDKQFNPTSKITQTETFIIKLYTSFSMLSDLLIVPATWNQDKIGLTDNNFNFISLYSFIFMQGVIYTGLSLFYCAERKVFLCCYFF